MKKIWNWLLNENNRKVLSFLGTGIVVIISASWTYFTYFDRAENKDANNRSPMQTNDDKIIRNTSNTPFMGVYIGINTQGTTRLPTKITFKHLGDKVTGTYTLSGMLGTMNGTVSGNTFNYVWELGGFSGRGVSIIQGNTINGTWGYDSSDNNGGTLTAQLQ
jgi:hypothetical protein